MNSESLNFEPRDFDALHLPADDRPESIRAWLDDILPVGFAGTLLRAVDSDRSVGHTPADFGLCELDEIRRKKQVIECILALLGMLPGDTVISGSTAQFEVFAESARRLGHPSAPRSARPARSRGRVSSISTARRASRLHAVESGITTGYGAVTWVALR